MKLHTVAAGIAAILFFAGCVSNINNNALHIAMDTIPPSGILPLENSNDDVTLYYIGSQVMEQSGFLSRHGQGYGYYAVALYDSSENAPNFVICAWINGMTFFIPSLLGVPTDLQEFDISAYLYIFDSTGSMIKVYKNANSFTKLAGLYYGQNPNKKASRYYSSLFKRILEQAHTQSGEINYLLQKAGPISPDSMQDARAKITEFFKLNKGNAR